MQRYAPAMLLPKVDTVRCTGCGWCVAACPPHVLSLQTDGLRKHAVLHDLKAARAAANASANVPLG